MGMGSERVYFALCNGRIKIGTSVDVQARVNSLAGGHPDGMRVLCTVDGGRDVEQAFHRKLTAHRVNREWFNDCEPVRRAISDFQRLGIASLREHYREPQPSLHALSAEPALPSFLDVPPDRWDLLIERIDQSTQDINERIAEIRLLRRLGIPKGDLVALVDQLRAVNQASSLVTTALQGPPDGKRPPDLVNDDQAFTIASALMEAAEAKANILRDSIRRVEDRFSKSVVLPANAPVRT